jgi:Cu2+-containing amine oxidase
LGGAVVAAALSGFQPGESLGAAAHPLDELSAEELQAAVAVLKAAGRIDEASRFSTLTLEEPAKAEVRAWKAGQPFTRRAQAVVKQGPRTFEAVVDLDAKTVASFAEVEGVQAGVLVGEWQAAQAAALADPGWLAAMAKRGYAPEGLADRVFCAPLSPGYFAVPELEGRRPPQRAVLRQAGLDHEPLRAADRGPDRRRRPERGPGRQAGRRGRGPGP